MTTNKDVEKCLWVTALIFMTYLLFGSFIVSKDFIDLAYLLIVYTFLILVKISNKKS